MSFNESNIVRERDGKFGPKPLQDPGQLSLSRDIYQGAEGIETAIYEAQNDGRLGNYCVNVDVESDDRLIVVTPREVLYAITKKEDGTYGQKLSQEGEALRDALHEITDPYTQTEDYYVEVRFLTAHERAMADYDSAVDDGDEDVLQEIEQEIRKAEEQMTQEWLAANYTGES